MNARSIRDLVQRLGEVIVLAGAYWATGKLGLGLALPPGLASPVWPPSGLALAVLLLRGRALWPGVWLGSLLVNAPIILNLAGNPADDGLRPLLLVAIASGSTLEALAGAFLVTRFIRSTRAFERPLDVLRFAGIALACTPIGATIGAAVLSRLSRDGAVLTPWITWWLGDFVGILTVTPLFLVWHGRAPLPWTPRRALEAASLVALTIAAWWIVLTGDSAVAQSPSLILLPLVVWTGFRFRAEGVAAFALLTSGIAIWTTVHGVGPFEGVTLDESLLVLQAFMGVVTLTGHVVAAAVAESRAARAAAEQANQAKSEFLATMSHELRTPLNAVLGMATVLESSYLDPLQRSCVTTIRNGGEALLAQIREILEHVRIEAGRTTLEPQVFDLCLCLQECADLVAAAAAARHLDLAWTVTDDCPRVVETDPARLRQVLVNLLSNAVSATARGEVVLSASHQWTGADEVELAFEVRDTGTGIAAEEVPLLFQPFGQVGRDPARRRSGTGLGLAIARRLSELMGGTITVESDVGRGSLFRCTIHARAAATAPVARETRSAPLAGKRLLVVDDNPTYRKLLGHLVRAWGCDVRFASSAPEAEAALADAGSRDAVLLDHHLGGEVEGPELAARLRRRLDGACPPLVLLTCVGHGADAELARPFAGVVTKPVRPAQLREVLQRLFERPAAPAAPELAGTASSWRPALRILVVEDNPVNQQVALLLLEQMGLKADVVGNGIEAVQSLERHPYDVVFMDVLMPEMDGLEASRRIRRHHAGQPGPRIVAMTAYALEGDRERCLAAGMDDFLSKPITLEDLKRVLDPALQPHAR